jgi:hypothetical protein
MDAMYSARVFGWVEHPNVSLVHPHVGEPSVCDSLSKDFTGVFVPFNGNDWPVSEYEVREKSSADSCENVHGVIIHFPSIGIWHNVYRHDPDAAR